MPPRQNRLVALLYTYLHSGEEQCEEECGDEQQLTHPKEEHGGPVQLHGFTLM